MRIIIEVIAFIVDIIKLSISAVIMGVRKLFGLKSSWKDWFMGYVPAHVSAYTLLGVMAMLGVKGVNKKSREGHLNKNRAVWQGLKGRCRDGRYIEKQPLMKELVYGRYAGDYNSCEVIAVYNALQYLAAFGSPTDMAEGNIDFPELLEAFERKGICAGGSFGTSPDTVLAYFKKKGYYVRRLTASNLSASKIEELSKCFETFIMTAYNDRNSLKAMIHTVSITYEDGAYVMHNAYEAGKLYSSLEKAVNEYRGGLGKPICLLGISNRNN